MAWTTPATFTTGNVLTAAQLNTNLRDNTNYLFDQPMALVSKAGNTTVATSTFGDFVFGTTNWSSPGITVTLAATSLKPTFAGVYECWASVTWAGSAAGYRYLTIYYIQGGNIATAAAPATIGANRISLSCSGVTPVVFNGSTDSVGMQVGQDSGSAQTLFGTSAAVLTTGSFEPCFLGIKMLGTGS